MITAREHLEICGTSGGSWREPPPTPKTPGRDPGPRSTLAFTASSPTMRRAQLGRPPGTVKAGCDSACTSSTPTTKQHDGPPRSSARIQTVTTTPSPRSWPKRDRSTDGLGNCMFPHLWRATTAKKSGDHAREISGPNTPIRLGYAARRAVSSYPAPLLSGPAFT